MTRAEAVIDTGADLHRWAEDLFEYPRSLTGEGVRQTLGYLRHLLPGLTVHEISSGTKVLDWTIPDEWNLHGAYIEDGNGVRLVDVAWNNLHVVGYSEPVDVVLDKEELERRLHPLPGQPDAIPYVTSYYRRTWGFCLTQRQRDELGDGPFHVVIDSTLEPGHLTYADLVIPGGSEEEVLFSTYVCHPSMANNELSGPVVTTALMRWIASLPNRRYSYRAVFVPETIGSIAYLARHLDHLRASVRAGWVITCVGDNRTYSYLPSRLGGTLADRISVKVLQEAGFEFDEYTFLERGSDERQWCSPGADLPVASLMRSKYGTYPEYHTSLDDLRLVTPEGLQGAFQMYRDCVCLLEANRCWRTRMPGEPHLSSRGLYPTTSFKGSAELAADLQNVLAYCDGAHDVMDLADRLGLRTERIVSVLEQLAEADVIQLVEAGSSPGRTP